uniref:Ubiquitin-like protease family profile domain-containing protein n=1 Tax=Aegilops tauschii TaxID=37682 RepID=M8CJZ5_AEGTA
MYTVSIVVLGWETGRKPKAFDFCIYCLAVLYLDKLDFGVRVVEQGAPRILAWKGNLIKHFSELDRKKSNLFGRRPFKKEIIQGIIGSAHCDNIKESGFQNVQEAIASNVLKFLSRPGVSSLFIAGGQGTLSKLGSLAKQKMGISSEDDRTHKKGFREYGESSDVNEKLKHVKSNINRTTVKINENMQPQNVRLLKLLNTAMKKSSLNFLFCSFFPIQVPEVEVVKKVRARVFNTMHHVGGQIAPPEAGQSNYQMINHMSPIGRTKLFSEDCNIGTSNNPPKLMALADKFSKTSQIIGTKQAPIPLADLSPSMEYILNYPKDDKLRSIATSFLGAASASRSKRLDLSNTLFFPTCLDNHWIVFVVNFKWKLFAFLDSFYDKDSYLHKSTREKFGNFVSDPP